MVQERIAVEFWLTVGGVRIRGLKMQLPIKAGVFGALLAALSGMSLPPAFGQIQTANPARENLEEQFVDPLTTLPQVFLKDHFSPVNYGTDVQTNQVVARIIIPRIPPNTLLPFVQLVRPSFSLVTVPGPKGGTRTDFGDMQLFDFSRSALATGGNRSQVWIRTDVCVPDGDVQGSRARRLAGGSSPCRCLYGRSEAAGRLSFAKSNLFRLHFS
jgi:hypothetical protein